MPLKANRKLLQGTLDMLILKALSHGPMHGYGVARRIEQLAKAALTVEEGSLYPALYRIEQQGWIKSEWDISDNNQRARYYTLTKTGRKQLEVEEADWDRLSSAISRVLRHA
jgi:transcriptional regulator